MYNTLEYSVLLWENNTCWECAYSLNFNKIADSWKNIKH